MNENITDSDEGAGGVFKVVDADNLEVFTSGGWRLVRVLPMTMPMTRIETVAITPQYTGGPSSRQDCFIELHPTQGFLVHKSADMRIDELMKQIIALNGQLSSDADKVRQHLDEEKASRKELARAKEEAEWKLRNLEIVMVDNKVMRDRLRKMELDLGKVRQDIGEREFNRIVAEKP